jgi:hypothetical protein
LGYSLGYKDGAGNTLLVDSGGGAGSVFMQGATGGNSNFQPSRAFNFSRGTNNLSGINGVTGHADGVFTWVSFLMIRQGPTGTLAGNPYGRGVNVPLDLTNMTGGAVLQKVALGNSSGAAQNTIGILSGGGSIRPSSNPPYTFGAVPPNAPITNFIVMAVEHVAGGLDNAYLWVNPLSLDLGSPALNLVGPALSTATTNVLGLFDYSFDRMRIFVGGQSSAAQPYGEAVMDEYRVGTTWADVTPFIAVPEPATACLVGLGALVLVQRWRRR